MGTRVYSQDIDDINKVMARAHAIAVGKDWWPSTNPSDAISENKHIVPSKLMLIVSEVSEALEDYRKDSRLSVLADTDLREGTKTGRKPIGFASELADVVIRVFDLAGWLGIDLAKAIHEKQSYNEGRELRHGGKAC